MLLEIQREVFMLFPILQNHQGRQGDNATCIQRCSCALHYQLKIFFLQTKANEFRLKEVSSCLIQPPVSFARGPFVWHRAGRLPRVLLLDAFGEVMGCVLHFLLCFAALAWSSCSFV